MRKTLLFSVMVLIFAISNINAKTIWLVNEGKWNPWDFTQMLLDDLKDSKIGNVLKYTERKPEKKDGDIVILMFGGSGNCNEKDIYPMTFLITRYVVTSNTYYDDLIAWWNYLLYDGNYYQAVRDLKKWILENAK